MKTERTSLFFMANLSSEVSRIFSAKENGDLKILQMAMAKAKSIISELKKLPDTKNNREIDILADVIDDLGQKNQKYQVSQEYLKSYFYPFAMRLMRM